MNSVVIGSGFGGIAAALRLKTKNHNELNDSIYKITFIGLASLTFSHILLKYLLEKNAK
jgi:NADH dehydrogenase FAD-containing subunit